MTIQEARDLLGSKSNGMTDKEISMLIQLVDFSLDYFEKKVFGKTINELENNIDHESQKER